VKIRSSKPEVNSISNQTDKIVKERIKSFLIVGETLDGIYTYKELQLVNIITFTVLLSSSFFTFFQALRLGTYWWFLTFGFLLGSFYFLALFQREITYAITKFRIIRLENDFITRFFFQSSRLIGFTDLHYEHVESINVGTAKVNMPRFYVSLIGVSIGWLALTQASFGFNSTFTELLAVLIIVASMINIAFSLPLTGVRMRVQSISGEVMNFPERETPQDFVDELILNCRTFLSYGAQ